MEHRVAGDYLVWRQTLRAVEDLGAFRPTHRNLIAADGRAERVDVAEMTASGFRIAHARPLASTATTTNAAT